MGTTKNTDYDTITDGVGRVINSQNSKSKFKTSTGGNFNRNGGTVNFYFTLLSQRTTAHVATTQITNDQGSDKVTGGK